MTPSQWSFGIAPTKKAAIGTRWFSVFETTETKITFGAELQFFSLISFFSSRLPSRVAYDSHDAFTFTVVTNLHLAK